MVDRSELLKMWALEAGFHRAGIADLAPSAHGAAFDDWLERGRHAGMKYMENYRDKRLAPATLLEGAKSALVVALHYAPQKEPPFGSHSRQKADGKQQDAQQRVMPRVARYAQGDDYHEVMKPRLRALGDRIEGAFPGTRSRSYVDTGPILERELAARAGLGAVGKNTNLLHRQGSWFLIGEILLTLKLTPDEPLADMCGSCTRCLDACPTQAFPEPFVLDAGKCISYWTIEHRGEIEPKHERLVGDWVFGCDICQEVCPWNEFHGKRGEQEFDEDWARAPDARSEVTLEGLLSMDRETYVETYRRSPMKRARLEGLKRNASIVLANSDKADKA